jgi:hypothetical protein
MAITKDLLVVPAWYDPKARFFVWDASTIHCGFLVVDSGALAYITENGPVFAEKLDQVDANWPPILLSLGCDLQVNGVKHRLYFSRPVEGAPRIREDLLTVVAETLTDYSDLAELFGGTLADVAQVGGIFGQLMSLVGAFMDYKRGSQNAEEVRARLRR